MKCKSCASPLVKEAKYCHNCGNSVGTKLITITVDNIDSLPFDEFKASIDDMCQLFTFQFPAYQAFEQRARSCEHMAKIIMTLTGYWGHMIHMTRSHKGNQETMQGQISQDKRDYLEKCISTLTKTIDTISRSFTMDTRDMDLSGKGTLGRKDA